ncbi:hypothetical protein HBI56_108810 [Parastagonospora nodorum]|nr:hypothetical protein HBH56_041360 [Parastagonospora nodorum]KAH3933373.1 hypothetical protein HBH54_069110 [Parastagonospora nodorum]KAH3943561.1 hypothetical protein HBH53_173280 [Parastagonospora nodorum]KAH3961885.1 hypothetical protein HBH52_228460 [Parastagonospora nodorum]KAH3980511.1 hypothetical protein HBH51_047110 [Parastagonospora nodorum]
MSMTCISLLCTKPEPPIAIIWHQRLSTLQRASAMEVQSTYNRLPKDHIRLLHVYPDETGQRIRCQLLATNINTGPDYQALSYAWANI